MTPTVSIVTPVYNRADTIQRTLDSVAGQSYAPIEHIVVDGGSTDGTLAIVQAHARRDPSVTWISEPDTGMYDAINKGLRRARGDVLAYVNSDDYYLPWTVEAAVASLEAGADVVFGDLGVLVRGDRSTFYAQFYREFAFRHYTYSATLAQPTVFWSRRVFDRIGAFDTTYRLLGDCDYWLRAAGAGFRFDHVDEILAVQVEHAGTLRATHETQLRAEFARLRRVHAPAAGPRGSRARPALARRVEWRVRQAQLLVQSRRNDGARRWPRFVQFLRDERVQVRPSYLLWHLLPRRVRPAVSLVDAARFERRVAAVYAFSRGRSNG